MDSETLRTELEALADRLSVLRAEAAEAKELSEELEQQLNETQGRHILASRAVADHEALIAAKEQELRQAEREGTLRRRDEAAERLALAVDQLLVAIEEHDAAVKDVFAQHEGRDPKPSGDQLGELWERLKEAVREKSDFQFGDERVEAAIRSGLPEAISSLPADLREVARARIWARQRARLGRET